MNTPFNPEIQNKNTDAKIVAALERISEVFRVLLWDKSKKIKLSPIQILILIYLKYHDLKDCTVSSLAAEFNMTPPTISDAVKILERKKLVKRIRSSEDLRYQFLKVTRIGEKMVNFSHTFVDSLIEIIKEIDQNKKEIFLATLLEIIFKLNQKGILFTRRMCFTCSYLHRENDELYCNLLEVKLKYEDLRIDCPEHQPI